MNSYYCVLDGRANQDIDDALEIDVYGEVTKTYALKMFKNNWRGIDSVLVAYQSPDGEPLSNPTIVSQQG